MVNIWFCIRCEISEAFSFAMGPLMRHGYVERVATISHAANPLLSFITLTFMGIYHIPHDPGKLLCFSLA